MPRLPNEFPFGITPSVATGGHFYDPAPDQSCTLRTIDPQRHGQIDHKQMPFITRIQNPTQSTLEEFSAPPEPGTIVYTTFNTGDPSTRAVCGSPNEMNNSQSVPGNNPIMTHLMEAMSELVNKNRPISYNNKEERKASVRAVDNETGEWMNALTSQR